MSHPYHATPNEEAQCLACQRIDAEEKRRDDEAQHVQDLVVSVSDMLKFFGWASLNESVTPNVVIKVRNALSAVVMDQDPI